MIERTVAEPTRWFVAKTRPNGEQKARFHLQRQGFEVYLPPVPAPHQPCPPHILAAPTTVP